MLRFFAPRNERGPLAGAPAIVLGYTVSWDDCSDDRGSRITGELRDDTPTI